MNSERRAACVTLKSFFLMITPTITCSKRSRSSNDVMVSPEHSKMVFSMGK